MKIEEKIERTDLETINEEFTTKCLEHMMNQHHQDIISIKMKIVRWKEIVKRHSIEENELRKEEKKMTEKIDKLFSVLQRERNQKYNEDDNADTLFNQDVEDELSVFQDRITIGKIADYEKDLQKQKEIRSVEKARLKEQNKEIQSQHKLQAQRKQNKKMRGELMLCERKIDSLLRVMKISNPEKIEDSYLRLGQNFQ